jgi:uncharacterized protein (TIGR03435 family)
VKVPGIVLDEVSRDLGVFLDHPVINQTGIVGTFDFDLEFAPDESTPRFSRRRPGDPPSSAVSSDSTPGGPTIFTALQEQLGLKLEPAKGPGEFFIVDHIERPSGN